jgi:protein-tyrosine-phosphatase
VGYTGVAMFEFKRNPSGQWILLEVNARPWGSLPLPVALGVDFPYRWYQLLVDGVETPPVEYRVGVYGRNLMPDMMAAVADAQSRELAPVRFGLFIAGRLAEMRRVLTRAEVQDVLVRDDLAPAREEVRRFFGDAVRRTRRRLPGAALRMREAAEAAIRGAAQRGRPVRVLFVCQGNICRSAYAATALRIRMPDEKLVQIDSAGMMPRPGRPTPELGLAAAARNGIDLRSHRSAWMTREAGQAASLIVMFDDVNVAAMADRYPDLTTPALKLGELIGIGDIYDPVDGDSAVFDTTFAAIGRGIQALARLLA